MKFIIYMESDTFDRITFYENKNQSLNFFSAHVQIGVAFLMKCCPSIADWHLHNHSENVTS